MANYLSYLEIVQEVEQALKQTSSSKRQMIKNMINMVYLNEILECDDMHPLFWLLKMVDDINAYGPTDISSITQAAQGVMTMDEAHGLSSGDLYTVYGITGMTELNNRTFRVGTAAQGTTATDIALVDLSGTAIDTSGYTAYSSGGKILHRGTTFASTIKVKEIHSFNWHDEIEDLKFITPAEAEKSTVWWNNSGSRPTRYTNLKTLANDGSSIDQLLWYYGSDSEYDARIWVVQEMNRLSADADVPILPPQFHQAIVCGTVARLNENKVEVESPQVWPTLYAQHLNAIRNYNRNWWSKNRVYRQEKPFLI